MRYRLLAMLVAFSLLAAGTTPARAGETLNYRLKWLFNVSVIGDLYAKTHGFFDAAGLAVTIKPGGPERDAIKELELGQAQFGVASADQVLRARSKGSPVVVLAQFFQINPLQWIYRSDNIRIARLSDLKDRVIGVTYGGNDEHILRTLLARADISEKEVRLFSVRYDYTPFFKNKVDIWPVYRNAQGVILKRKFEAAGERVAFFNPADYGVKFVANSLVTSERMMRERPDTVRRFCEALLKGWNEALARPNREQTLHTLQHFDRDTARHILEDQLEITGRLVKPVRDLPIGAIDIMAWKQTEQIMLEQRQIPGPVGIEKYLKPAGKTITK